MKSNVSVLSCLGMISLLGTGATLGDPGAPAPGAADLAFEKLGVLRFDEVELKLPAGDIPSSFQVKVPWEGKERTLVLRRRSLRAPDFKILLQVAGGSFVEAPVPPSRTYVGTVAGEPETLAAASLLSEGLAAHVSRSDGRSWSVRPMKIADPRSPREIHLVYSEEDVLPFTCGQGGLPVYPEAPPAEAGEEKGGGGAACNLKVAGVAFDSDYEFYDLKCGKSTDTANEMIEAGLNITNLIYIRDTKITHSLSAIVLRTDPATDIYAVFPDGSDFGGMLGLIRSEWNANMGHIDRDMAYLLTGKPNPQYGGLAWVSVVCTNYAYGVGIGGWGYEGIFRHEIGHNWSPGHDCGAERGYIMCGNSIDAFSYFNIKKILNHAASRTCLDEIPHESIPEPPYARPDPVVAVQGEGPIPIDVVASDTDTNCDQLRLAACDSRSAFGAELLVLDFVRPEGPEGILYAPRSDFTGTDIFRYTVSDGAGFEAVGAAIVDIVPRAMILHLKLDETSGTEASDSSGYGHTGELRGAMALPGSSVAGRHGQAFGFPGVADDHVTIEADAHFDLRRGMAAAAWFRVGAFAGDGETIVGKGSDSWRLKRDGQNRTLKFTCTGIFVSGTAEDEVRGAVRVDDGGWHHAAGVFDGARISLYIDGALDRSLPASGLIHTNTSSVRIGENAWNGAIDEVRIYNHGLTAEEVRLLFLDGRTENADPQDGASGVIPGASLSWLGAPSASAHDVYFGTDPATVASAGPASPEYKGRRTQTSYAPVMTRGTSYFWRIDEVSGGTAIPGEVRKFTTAFAFTDFNEPPLNASSYVPKAGSNEIGFKTVSSPTSGSDPFAGVIDTGSTPTTPVFSHRSVNATTTFDVVPLTDQGPAAVALMAQARSTGYEVEDLLEAYVTDGTARIYLVSIPGAAPLAQKAGRGYLTFAAAIPAEWTKASLAISTSSNSSAGSERYDFDRIRFTCGGLFPAIASTYFAEPSPGADSYAPGAGAKEIGFKTVTSSTGGASPFAGVREAGVGMRARYISHTSLRATTTFDAVDLRGWGSVRATAVLRVRATGYEADDSLELSVTNGSEKVEILKLDGDTGIDNLANDGYTAFWAAIPPGWESAVLAFSTSSNSTAGSEGFDLRSVEFVSMVDGACGPAPVEAKFRRGDANGDGSADLGDALKILFHLFLGAAQTCEDAADTNDDGNLDIADPVSLLGYLFLAGPAPRPPFPSCGLDTTADALICGSYGPCN